MNITLLHHNPDALDLLLFTKQTRLAMSPGLMDDIRAWPQERKLKELDYMLGTIQSSWEFCDYVFLIDGVSRAFTHQLVRTRQGSYAQQSQRTVDMEGFDYVVTGEVSLDGKPHLCRTGIPVSGSWLAEVYEGVRDPVHADNWNHVTMRAINFGYAKMRELGVPPQDARGVLPTNVATNIVGKFNLRTLADMAKLRLCTRTQGEYQDVFREMRKLVIQVHPWAEPFLRVACAATGVCQFPNYMECPIKGPTFNPDTGRRWDGLTHDEQGLPVQIATRAQIQAAWETTRFEAIPKQVPAP
jgi:flavin-dependent thymidylate synthase